jgi:hypothetical protein
MAQHDQNVPQNGFPGTPSGPILLTSGDAIGGAVFRDFSGSPQLSPYFNGRPVSGIVSF